MVAYERFQCITGIMLMCCKGGRFRQVVTWGGSGETLTLAKEKKNSCI